MAKLLIDKATNQMWIKVVDSMRVTKEDVVAGVVTIGEGIDSTFDLPLTKPNITTRGELILKNAIKNHKNVALYFQVDGANEGVTDVKLPNNDSDCIVMVDSKTETEAEAVPALGNIYNTFDQLATAINATGGFKEDPNPEPPAEPPQE